MIKVFAQTDRDFTSNGDIAIKPYKSKITKADNGKYYLELECPIDYLDHIVANNIIVAPEPAGAQPFRITTTKVTKTKITAKCKHIFYDADNYLIADSYVVDKTCNDALDHLNSATDNASPFSTLSNIETVNSYRCVRKSLTQAIQTVLERWGGHLVRDQWQIKILDSIGNDNGVVIQYKKNLKDITVNYDWSNVVTKLLPVGKDGILLDDLYVSSEIQYDIPYTKTVNFSQEIEPDDYSTEGAYIQALKDDLRIQAQAYVDANCIPKVNYTLKANIDKITDIGDVIEVKDERLGVNITTRVLSFKYDCILGKYTEVQFGNAQPKLSDLMSDISAQTEKQIDLSTQAVTLTLESELQEAQQKIFEALGSSYCIYEGNQILIVDELPKENAHNVMRIDSAGIGFSQNGINGTFTSAWLIDGTLDMQNINVINLTCDLIKGGVLKLGSNLNLNGQLEVYDADNTLIAELNNNGLKMYGSDGSYVLMNNDVGFAGYDADDNKIFWADRDEFHMVKAVVENEITLSNRIRFIPIDTASNSGVGIVSVVE